MVAYSHLEVLEEGHLLLGGRGHIGQDGSADRGHQQYLLALQLHGRLHDRGAHIRLEVVIQHVQLVRGATIRSGVVPEQAGTNPPGVVTSGNYSIK